MWKDTTRAVPTLAELRKHSSWVWVYCERCLHHSPAAFVPLMIRWGADASSDKLRQCDALSAATRARRYSIPDGLALKSDFNRSR
jgi:hypothetical protein